MTRWLLFWFVMLLLVGCEAQATPIAVRGSDVPTPSTPSPDNTEPAPIRYGFLANTAPYVADADLVLLEERAQVDTVDNTTSLSDYDVVVSYGALDGWQRSNSPQHIALIINASRFPNDLRRVIGRLIDPQRVVQSLNLPGLQASAVDVINPIEARTIFANSGHPDGYALVLAANSSPGLDQIGTLFAEATITLNRVSLDDPRAAAAHLSLISYTQDAEREAWIERVGADNIIDLYSLPISYRADPALKINFTNSGWPLPAR